jgi:hypothetical protein
MTSLAEHSDARAEGGIRKNESFLDKKQGEDTPF